MSPFWKSAVYGRVVRHAVMDHKELESVTGETDVWNTLFSLLPQQPDPRYGMGGWKTGSTFYKLLL